MEKVIIIGGVAGGASCATRLRRLDENVKIVLLERGEHISYANCGLPYHVGDVIKSRDALLVQKPEVMKKRFGIDVRVKNEVTSINRDKHTVTVKNLDTNESYEESYDKLVISTGSSPMRPPIKGIESDKIKTLWTVPDTDKIRAIVHSDDVKDVAVIGGGFIGLEMAENLRHTGMNVSLVEAMNQVMAPLDYEMAQMLHGNIEKNGVSLYLGDGVSSFEDMGDKVKINLASGTEIIVDLVILSIGVRPNSELAREAGLTLNARGGIVVDDTLLTSDSDIYAVGDAIEVEDFIYKDKTMIPLAGPANKQGRIAANNIVGGAEKYEGTQGTSIAKVFDLTAAVTGTNEKVLNKRGLIKDKDYKTIIITQNSHAGYYPGATPMVIKAIFSIDGSKIYGAQIVGYEGVDKRIDTISAAIRLGASITDLKNLEFAYAPPYSSAKDPVNMIGFVAENVLKGITKFSDWDVIENNPDVLLLDIREDPEVTAFVIPNSQHIPLSQLRSRLDEIDKSKKIVTLCAIGVRSYNAARILMQQGFDDVSVYPAGTRFYQYTHYKKDSNMVNDNIRYSDSGEVEKNNEYSKSVDCSGMQCQDRMAKFLNSIDTLKKGEILKAIVSDTSFADDIKLWCEKTGNNLISQESYEKGYTIYVKKNS